MRLAPIPRPHAIALAPLCLALASLFLPAPLLAQGWHGPAAVEVEVTDDDGEPIEGASVTLRLDEGQAGPAPASTDGRGRVVVGGLAEGEWYVEVSHEGYMLFAAYIRLREGKKPDVAFSSQVNTETSWTPMRVDFSKAKGDWTPAPPSPRPDAPRTAEPRRQPPPKVPPRAAEEPSPPPTRRDRPSEVVRQPAPAPAQPPTPVEEAEPPPEPPAEAPEGAPEEAVEVAAPDDQGPAPEVDAEPAPPPSPTPRRQEPPAGDLVPPPAERAVEPAPSAEEATPPQPAAEEPAAREAGGEPSAPPAQEAAEEPAGESATDAPTVPPVEVSPPGDDTMPEAAPPSDLAEAEPPVLPDAPAAPGAEEPEGELPDAQRPEPERPEPERPETEGPETEGPETERPGTEGPETEPAPEHHEAEPPAPQLPAPEPPGAELPRPEPSQPEQPEAEPPPTERPEPERPERPQAEPEAPRPPSPGAPDQPAAEGEPPLPTAEPPRAEPPRPQAPEPRTTPSPEERPQGEAVELPGYLSSHASGDCPGCQAGEWAVIAQELVAKRDSILGRDECPGELGPLAAAARHLAEAGGDALAGFAGPLSIALMGGRDSLLEAADRRRVRDELGRYQALTSSCRVVAVLLPRGASFVGYQFEAWDALGGGACLAGRDCPLGQARWSEPQSFSTGSATVIYGVFENRSSRRERRAKMTVYFEPPTVDWRP